VKKRRLSIARVAAAIAVLLAVLVVGKGWHDTMSDPVVRRAALSVPGMPAGSAPVSVLLMSDFHVAGPDMPPSRLARIVGEVNALHPDVVLLAGDFVSEKRTASRFYSTSASIAPLAGLRPRLGTFAVLGNHDHWRDAEAIQRDLEASGIVVLDNEARQVGSLVLAGLDDDFTGHARLSETLAAMKALPGGRVILSHSPDPFPDLPPGTGLMLAGHTHCGQIRYPWGGTPATMSRYGERYACGLVHEHDNVLIVTAGLGTSVLPFRFGTRPDVWLVELRPE
jgi:predicted MPP superfamily phosphohydrolase